MKGMNRTKVKQQYDKLTSILQNLVNTCNNYLTLLHGPFPPFPAPKGICFVLKLSRKFSLVVHQHQMAASHAHHCLKAICLQSYRCHRFFPWETVSTLERHNTRKKTQNRDRFEYFEWSKKIEPQRFCQVLPATICPSNVLPSDPSDSKPSESNTRTGRPFGPEEK